MNHSELVAGQIFEVTASAYSTPRLAKVLEVGTFQVPVYSGRYSTRTSYRTVKGARVAYLDRDGIARETREEQKRVWGTPEETYIDPFDGAVVVTPATEDTWTTVTVNATEWLPSRAFTGTAASWNARIEREDEARRRKANAEERIANWHPCITQTLGNAGVYEGNARQYTGKVELTYAEFIKLVDHLDPNGDRRAVNVKEVANA